MSKCIGCFYELCGEGYPRLFDMITSTPIAEKNKVLMYLKNGRIICASPAILIGVISEERLDQELFGMTDNIYVWRSDIAYHFDEYNLKLPDDFIQHVLNQS